jgi:hypothetical protein
MRTKRVSRARELPRPLPKLSLRREDASKPLPNKPAVYNRTLAKVELFVHFPVTGELGGAGGLAEPPSSSDIGEADRRSLKAGLAEIEKHS